MRFFAEGYSNNTPRSNIYERYQLACEELAEKENALRVAALQSSIDTVL